VVWYGESPADAAHPCQVPWVPQRTLARMEGILQEVTWLCPRCGKTQHQPYVLLDGHHRYAICRAHGIHFDIVEAATWVETREDALIWIIQNQCGRRNLMSYQRIELLEQLRPLLEKEAQAHQGARTDFRPYLAGSHDTKQAIADQAGVSRETVRKAELIMQEADEPTKEALRRGEHSIDSVYKMLRPRQAAKNRQPRSASPALEKHLCVTDRLLELITAILEQAETLRGELTKRCEQFPQAMWVAAYKKMEQDLRRMQEYLLGLLHRTREGHDWSLVEHAASGEASP
jgi:CDGSH-type Zn-finger protein